MTIEDLNKNLDNIITTYEHNAGEACKYCDDTTGNALYLSHQATSKALSAFKNEILLYLKNS